MDVDKINRTKASLHQIPMYITKLPPGEMKVEKNDRIQEELDAWKKKGISLWLEGKPHTPKEIKDVMCVQESCSYMRDYVFDGNGLSEIHFTRISNESNTQKIKVNKPKPNLNVSKRKP